jgi:hypothetical protein
VTANPGGSFVKGIEDGKTGVLHYRGTSGAEDKDLTDWEANLLLNQISNAGFRPVLLDFDFRAKIPETSDILRPDKRHPWLWNGERVPLAGIRIQHQLRDCGTGTFLSCV